MKILYCWDHHERIKPFIESRIRSLIRHGYDITSLKHRDELGIKRAWTPDELDRTYLNKDHRLIRWYDKVRSLTESHDVLIVNHENVYHPEFIKSLNDIYTVLVSADDPDSSDYCSKPYVHAFDHSFAWGVNFDGRFRQPFLGLYHCLFKCVMCC